MELPDGRVQRVKYRVSKYSGFVAQVSYEQRSNFEPAPKYESVPDYIPRKLHSMIIVSKTLHLTIFDNFVEKFV